MAKAAWQLLDITTNAYICLCGIGKVNVDKEYIEGFDYHYT